MSNPSPQHAVSEEVKPAKPTAEQWADAMRKAYAYCPLDMSHLDRMRWMGEYVAREIASPPLTDREAKLVEALRMARDAERLRAEGKPVPVRYLVEQMESALALYEQHKEGTQ